MKKWILLLGLLLPVLGFTQDYSVDWFKVAGGGGTSTGGIYSATFTIGQADAGGPMQGPGYSVEGGFWSLYSEQISSVTGNAPMITAPTNRFVNFGGSTSLNASVSGSSPLFYQWQENGVNIPGATNATLDLADTSTSDGGSYTLIAENAYGCVTSSVVKMTVVVPISFGLITLITFDDLPETTDRLAVTNGYFSLSWKNFYELDGVAAYGSGGSGYAAAVVSSKNVVYNGNAEPASITGSEPFNFSSAYLTAAWNDNLQVQVEGFAGGAMTYSNSYTLSATSPTLIYFNYLGVTNIYFNSFGGTQHPGYVGSGEHFAMDNVTLRPTVTNVSGFGDNGLNWTLNPSSGNGSSISNDVLTITTSQSDEANSAYYNIPQGIGGDYSASFTWDFTNDASSGDGFTFILQNSSLNAVGGEGGDLGYQTNVLEYNDPGISNSIAIGLWNYLGGYGYPVLRLGVNGIFIQTTSLADSGIDFETPNEPVQFNVNYTAAASNIVVQLTQGAVSTNYTFQLGGSIPSLIGSNSAYVGFTGGTGSAVETQTISDFSFVPGSGGGQINIAPIIQIVTAANGNLTFEWAPLAAYPPVSYQVQYTTNLVSGNWINLGGLQTSTSFTDAPVSDSQRFYRVLLVQ